jgi:two-component system, NarL family, sensor histidine kinase DesK
VTAVRQNLRCAWHRNASVLVWTPVLLVSPVLGIGGGPAAAAFQVALVLVMAGAATAAALTARAAGRSAVPYAAFSTLVAAAVAGAEHGGDWLPTWTLVALVAGNVLRGWWLPAGLLVAVAGWAWAAWLSDVSTERLAFQGFVVLLAGVAVAVLTRLIDVVDELRRTREELARRAVAEERERFSRDLHDLLGHTLSVMVVKAQAVRRLVDRDPVAAATHAEDIEAVGRKALVEVREAVDATRSVTLDSELDGARRALDAAGIRAEMRVDDGPVPAEAEQALAWVVRESATNVLRHSGASRCRFELRRTDKTLTLVVSDDGVGGPTVPPERRGGLDGLRRRLGSVGGWLQVGPNPDGFRLTAHVPAAGGPR